VIGAAPPHRLTPASAGQAPHTAVSFAGKDRSVGAARAYIRAALTDRVGAVDEAELMVSELVTNALRYTQSSLPGGEIVVSVAVGAAHARVEVKDAGPLNGHLPAMRDYFDETGRGLQIVAACATSWGWGRCGPGGEHTVVWFEMARGE
jgi:serine/threonine-protein kinase RsbW